MAQKPRKRKIIRAKNEYKKKSRLIRLSPEMDEELLKVGRRSESYDNILRRVFGLKVNKHEDKVSEKFFGVLDENSSYLFKDEAEARGMAIRLAAKHGTRVPFKVLKLRTIV